MKMTTLLGNFFILNMKLVVFVFDQLKCWLSWNFGKPKIPRKTSAPNWEGHTTDSESTDKRRASVDQVGKVPPSDPPRSLNDGKYTISSDVIHKYSQGLELWVKDNLLSVT